MALKKQPNKHLNLGCGHRILEGFTNVDKYTKGDNIDNYDIYQLPYKDCSQDILFSAHSLEHLPIRHAKMALFDWYRVLAPGGKLVLMVPDLELIMCKLLENNTDFDWYLYTLFGYQIDTNIRDDKVDHPVDYGQFHTCGFTKKRLKQEMEQIGYKVTQLFNYDGWNTPSIFIEAKRI